MDMKAGLRGSCLPCPISDGGTVTYPKGALLSMGL